VEALPTFNDQRVESSRIHVAMSEFQQKVLPDRMYAGLPDRFADGTYLWGYAVTPEDWPDRPDVAVGVAGRRQPTYPGVTIVARQRTPTTVTYVNNLSVNPVLRHYLTIDQTIHWADPRHQHGSADPYTGSIPTVVHLHGAEVQSTSDGAPEAWFTSDGRHGPGYASRWPTAANAAVYQYPNSQPSTALWFHDHGLGVTRTNLYTGLAAFYLIRDRFDTGERHNPLGLPAGDFEIELMIQDRQFDTNGQLLFPDSATNPSLVDGPPGNPKLHPFWIPEFFGDAMVVNGRTWPYLEVEPRRYRFRILNASNARFLRMGIADLKTGAVGPSVWQIGTDGGLLDRPVRLEGRAEPSATGPTATTRLFLAPAERADVIIDFAAFAGATLTLTNDAQAPFPSGDPLAEDDPTRQIMQFRVARRPARPDLTFDPGREPALRGGPAQDALIVRLAEPEQGTLASGVAPLVKRQLILFEAGGPTGAPTEDFVNNTEWDGERESASERVPIPGAQQDAFGQHLWMSELPRLGSTEVWEFLNLTEDAHPLHLHLVQFQLINRQAVTRDPSSGDPSYLAAYAAAFPGGRYAGVTADGKRGLVDFPPGTIIPGYGPPLRVDVPNADGALGGNPAFGPYLHGAPLPPAPSEAGWKDTIKAYPGYVNRFAIRWAPQATSIDDVRPGQNLYSFDPTQGPGYLVHCHILDHEDNEMMRPYLPRL
jgi:FtsP/CotA-like multicopper oxidase with cupredoxin domain